MNKYNALFEKTAPTESVFADKSALDPLTEPDIVVAREDQERKLATMLNGVNEGYMPTTLSIYGPPGTGKTMTTRRVCREFADRNEAFHVEYINLKECRTLFSAANEILFELTGEEKQAYEGLDGVFTGIWEALEEQPGWTVLLLDEIDHVKHDSNYDPNEFFYRLLRGEGRLQRDLSLSVWLLSNELLEVDLRLDSRVQSTMSDESVFFPPYSREDLKAVLDRRVKQAFRDGTLPEEVFDYGVRQAARRWGDARKALTLFRQAGKTANERSLERVSQECIDANMGTVEREEIREKLLSLRPQHFFVMYAVTHRATRSADSGVQPVTTQQVQTEYERLVDNDSRVNIRAIQEILGDLEIMGLIKTSIQSQGRNGRIKRIRPTFDPTWARQTYEPYLEQSDHVDTK